MSLNFIVLNEIFLLQPSIALSLDLQRLRLLLQFQRYISSLVSKSVWIRGGVFRFCERSFEFHSPASLICNTLSSSLDSLFSSLLSDLSQLDSFSTIIKPHYTRRRELELRISARSCTCVKTNPRLMKVFSHRFLISFIDEGLCTIDPVTCRNSVEENNGASLRITTSDLLDSRVPYCLVWNL